MKPSAHILKCLLAALPLMLAAGPLPLPAAPAPKNAGPEIQPSVFDYPNSTSKGRDPFFPDTTRLHEDKSPKPSRGPALTDLTLKSILGTPPQVIAVINNHTFAPGEEGDIITKSGQRLHIHCVAINPNTMTATIEVNGTSVTLTYSGVQ
jgi:hypothetical protein